MPKHFDVIVVGAGMIGTTSACLFARQGLRVGLVEIQAVGQLQTTANGRVSAINLASSNLFKALEVWPGSDRNHVCPYHSMQVWDQNSPAKITFEAADLGRKNLGYIIENQAIVAAMLAKLQQNYNVAILDSAQVIGIDRHNTKLRLKVILSDQEIETRLLVGADGSHSRVRKLCDLETRFSDFGQDAIVTAVSTSLDHQSTARQCFLETGPVAMLPLADGRCSIVWSCDREQADELMQLDDLAFCARLQPLFLSELGEIIECQPRQRFALGQHHSSRYIADSVALIGDAAHITHPLAGLGANLGFLDAAALAEVVELAARHGRDIGQQSVLRRYERWRKGDNALVLGMMKGFKGIFGSSHASAKMVRSTGMNLADSIPPLKNTLAKYATGLYGDIPAICQRKGGHV